MFCQFQNDISKTSPERSIIYQIGTWLNNLQAHILYLEEDIVFKNLWENTYPRKPYCGIFYTMLWIFILKFLGQY